MKRERFSIKLLSIAVLFMLANNIMAEHFVWYDGQNAVTFFVPKKSDPVVSVALEMFADDMDAVTGKRAIKVNEKQATICVLQLDKMPSAKLKSLVGSGVPVDALKRKIDAFI